MPRKTKSTSTKQSIKAPKIDSFVDRIEQEVNNNQSKLNLILGALIVLVLGVLVFNYFDKNKAIDTASQNTQNQEQQGDASPENLPGKYTIKEGDTLFSIADKYYKDGYKYPELVTANKLANPDAIEVGQIIDIPKLEISTTSSITPMADATTSPTISTTMTPTPEVLKPSSNAEWGPKIDGDKYTVQAGDWLSKIAGRAYGDVMQYEKIAKANNITNPDVIEVGTVLTIPR